MEFQDIFLHPILVHSIIEKKENIGSQMGHTKKIYLKKLKFDLMYNDEKVSH